MIFQIVEMKVLHVCKSILLRVWTTHYIVSEWLLINANSAISWREQVNFQWDDDVHFALDQHM
jgi:hypothetical protein